MATKKAKRAAALAKRDDFLKAERERGLAALRKSDEQRLIEELEAIDRGIAREKKNLNVTCTLGWLDPVN